MMRPGVVRPAVAVIMALGTACAYYNGLYNANRLANEARHAESKGRRGEARSLWLQAAAKADSVASRYPDSKYRDDALLMSGLAHSRVGECLLSVEPLTQAIASSDDPVLVAQSKVVLGRCYLELGHPDSVLITIEPVVSHPDVGLATEARSLRGRARLATGDAAGAAADLRGSGSAAARHDLALALLATGELDTALDVLWLLLREDFDEARWNGVLQALGSVNQLQASMLVDEWVEGGRIDAEQMAQLLLADGRRWGDQDSVERAADRFDRVGRVSSNTAHAREAWLNLADLRLRLTEDPADAADLAEAYDRAGGSVAQSRSAILRRIAALEDQSGDQLELFRLAEAVRDSLGSTDLAIALFRRLVRDHPMSVLSPKALLAIASLRPTLADSIRTVLLRDYPRSPYTELVLGGAGAGFAALEDSLRAVSVGRPDTIPNQNRGRDEK